MADKFNLGMIDAGLEYYNPTGTGPAELDFLVTKSGNISVNPKNLNGGLINPLKTSNMIDKFNNVIRNSENYVDPMDTYYNDWEPD